MAKAKLKEPSPTTCLRCWGMGYRGMDRCNICDMTGSVFFVKDEAYPNTKEGYEEAKAALNGLAKKTSSR